MIALSMSARIFTTHDCVSCGAVKNYLKNKNISFVEVFIDEDNEAAQEMIDMSGQFSVPVTEINGKIVIGFNRQALEAAIR